MTVFQCHTINSPFVSMHMQLLMTWIAVVKVDDLGRRPLLIGGVSGIVSILYLILLISHLSHDSFVTCTLKPIYS